MLDCCFSGRAIDTLSGEGVPTGQLDISGTYVLTATAATQLALAPAGERHTAFTGALLGVLREGIPGGGPLIRVADLHRELAVALEARARPRPQQRNTDTIGDLAIARNRRG